MASDESNLKATGRTGTVRVQGEVLIIEQPSGSSRKLLVEQVTAVALRPYQPLAMRSPDGRIRISFRTVDSTGLGMLQQALTITYSTHAADKEFRALNRYLLRQIEQRRKSTATANSRPAKKRGEIAPPPATDVELVCACGRRSKARLRSTASHDVICTKCKKVLLPFGTRLATASDPASCATCPGVIAVGNPMVFFKGKTWHVGCVPNMSIPERREGEKRAGSRRSRSVRTVSGGLPGLGRRRR